MTWSVNELLGSLVGLYVSVHVNWRNMSICSKYIEISYVLVFFFKQKTAYEI